jgi:hypothetical protein
MDNEPIGRVLRSSTAGFSAGARVNQLDAPAFGMLVKAEPRSSARECIYGLLYDVHIDDDPLVRQLVLADTMTDEMISDQRHNRIVPIEMSVLAIAYRDYSGVIRHALPPRPPLSLDPVYMCSAEEILEVTQRFDYFRLVLSAGEVPSEQLMAANLLMAAGVRPEGDQYGFLVMAGRELARLMSGSLEQLDYILRLIYPTQAA